MYNLHIKILTSKNSLSFDKCLHQFDSHFPSLSQFPIYKMRQCQPYRAVVGGKSNMTSGQHSAWHTAGKQLTILHK